jgi:hypothetical protein
MAAGSSEAARIFIFSRMRVRLVLAPQNSGWVIGKMAHRLRDALVQLGHDAQVASEPDGQAEVNHWMSFAFADGCESTLNTMFVTHADDPFKVRLIRDLLDRRIQLALCMSPHAVEELANLGVPRQRLWFVLPAIDDPVPLRRLRIGITTRVYDDGRKREVLLVKLAREMRLDAFHFDIFGEGWQPVIPQLESAGAVVTYDPGTQDWQGDYARIRAAIPAFDYYLYMGMDEGSLGTLDAMSAGVKTIVTAQGFHLNLPGGIDHPFTDYESLREIFQHLDARVVLQRRRLAEWTWETYALEHLDVWEAMLRARPADVSTSALAIKRDRRNHAGTVVLPPGAVANVSSGQLSFYMRALAPTRIRGALARARLLRPLRKLLGH